MLDLSLDGYSLRNHVMNIETLEGRVVMPALRTEDVIVPGSDGVIPIYDEPLTDREEVWKMWVRGGMPDGTVPSPGTTHRQTFERNLDVIMRLMSKRHAPLLARRERADGTFQEAMVRITQGFQPSIKGGVGLAKFNAAVQFPDVYWRDPDDLTWSNLMGANANTLVMALVNSHHISDAIFKVEGPTTAFTRITDVGSGHWIELQLTMSSNQTWTFNTKTLASDVNGVYAPYKRSSSASTLDLTPIFDPSTGDSNIYVKLSVNNNLTITARRTFL